MTPRRSAQTVWSRRLSISSSLTSMFWYVLAALATTAIPDLRVVGVVSLQQDLHQRPTAKPTSPAIGDRRTFMQDAGTASVAVLSVSTIGTGLVQPSVVALAADDIDTAMSVGGSVSSPSPSPVTAPPENRPRAPISALVPATRQRILLQRALSVASQLADDDVDEGTPPTRSATQQSPRRQLLQELESLVERPASSVSSIDRKTLPMAARYRMDQKIVNSDERLSKLSGRSVRASLNVYTNNLQFGETYVLTAAPDVRKQMIRNDRLPDVKTVITADLDLRDLYRNKIQTLVEDAQAELYNERNSPDYEEILDLLQEASIAMDKWFSFISTDDVERALTASSSYSLDESKLELPQQNFRGFNPYLD